MTLMPVSKISDFVERSDNGGGARCTERHWTSDDVAEHVEHPRKDALADRRFQRSARVEYVHAAREALRGRQRDSAHVLGIALCEHFDDDLPFATRVQHRGDRRQTVIETHIDDAAAHRDDDTAIRQLWFIVHEFPLVVMPPLSVGAVAGRLSGKSRRATPIRLSAIP